MPLRKLVCLLLWALLAARPVSAQSVEDFTQQVPMMSALLSEFITDTHSFVAQGELRLLKGDRSMKYSLPFTVAMDQGVMRWEVKLSDIGKEVIPDEMLLPLKQAGWERLQLIYHPKTGARLVIPAERAYVNLIASTNGPSKLENEAAQKQGQLVKKFVGYAEEGKQFYKTYTLSFPDSAPKDKATLWENQTLGGLPTMLVVENAGQKYGFYLRKVRMGKPDAKVFAMPSDYQKASSVEALITKAVFRSLGQVKEKLSLTDKE